jgi:hypothetical protein
MVNRFLTVLLMYRMMRISGCDNINHYKNSVYHYNYCYCYLRIFFLFSALFVSSFTELWSFITLDTFIPLHTKWLKMWGTRLGRRGRRSDSDESM